MHIVFTGTVSVFHWSLIQVFSLTDFFPGLSDNHCLMNHGPRVSFLKSWPDISPDSSARTVATVEPYMHVRQELPLLVFNAVTWDLELKHLVNCQDKNIAWEYSAAMIITGHLFVAISTQENSNFSKHFLHLLTRSYSWLGGFKPNKETCVTSKHPYWRLHWMYKITPVLTSCSHTAKGWFCKFWGP